MSRKPNRTIQKNKNIIREKQTTRIKLNTDLILGAPKEEQKQTNYAWK